MKASMKNRIKFLLTGYSEHAQDFLTGDEVSTSGTVGTTTAMKYSAVNSCIRVRAETFASIPAILYKKNTDGREPVTDLMIWDILHNRPNEEMSAFNFKETILTNFDISGNVVCEKLLNKKGDIVGLYPYNHELVQIGRNKETNKLEYTIGSGTVKKILTRDNVFHVPNLSFDGVVGLSPITYAAMAIQLGLTYETFGVNFYKNGALTSGVFEHPQTIGDQAYERLKRDLKKSYAGLKNIGTPMILESGMKWNPVSINPIDAQLLESKYFQIEDICRIYRVPQHMVNKLDRSTFSNIEEMALEFVMYCVLPICKRFEDNINSQLLTPKQRQDGYFVEFKIDGLLRGNAKSRSESYSIGRLGGWLSVNDIRRLENLSPIPNGNIYLEPMNYKEAGTEAETYSNLAENIYNMIKERRTD